MAKSAPLIPEDQCLDWPISIQDGVLKKRVPVKFPVDMKAVRAREKAKRELMEKTGKTGEYVVTVTKGGQPRLAPPAQASKLTTIIIVVTIFTVLLLASTGAFVYLMVPD